MFKNSFITAVVNDVFVSQFVSFSDDFPQRFQVKACSMTVHALECLHLLNSDSCTFLVCGTSFQEMRPCQVIGTWSGAIIRRELRIQGRCHNLDWYWRIFSFGNFGKRLSTVTGLFPRCHGVVGPGKLSFENNCSGMRIF